MHSSLDAFSSLHTQQGFTAAAASPGGLRSEARFAEVGGAVAGVRYEFLGVEGGRWVDVLLEVGVSADILGEMEGGRWYVVWCNDAWCGIV